MHEHFRDIIQRDYPRLGITSFALLGEGEDHRAFAVNGDWIFRFAKDEESGRAATRDEAGLLRFLHGVSPLPVPAPHYANEEHAYLGYERLAGVPLLQVRDRFFPRALGAFLTAVHAVPLAGIGAHVDEDRTPLEEWRAEARATFAAVRQTIPPERVRGIEAFLLAPAPAGAYTPTLAHNDLGIEHILVDAASRRVTGIIDWGDAAIADPARDLGALYRDLGDETLDAVLGHYRPGTNEPGALRERAVFYGRCAVFEDLAYGLRTGRDAYRHKTLGRLFG